MAKKSDSFEDSLARLTAIVAELEAGEVPLEKGVALFKEGAALAASCRKRLDAARTEVAILHQGVWKDLDPRGLESEAGEHEAGDGDGEADPGRLRGQD
jgi:exodeoxyribonuclease VII small subunit